MKQIYSEPVTVIGAGSYGTSLAIALARNGHKTYLWGHQPEVMAVLAKERKNQAFLPDIPFPDSLEIESDLAQALSKAKDLLIVVPSHVFADVLTNMKPFIRPEHRIMWATKGLERDTGRLLQTVAEEILGKEHSLAVLSGPTFAKELAAGMPTAIALASNDPQFADEMQQRIHCTKSFRVYLNNDMVGTQLGGAIKNVIAIGAGISDGMGFGANARTALITRGLAEISRLGESLGANPKTFMGMAGLGDLVLTCTDNQSRNRRFGLAIGQGKMPEEAMAEIGQVVEGFYNTKEAYLLAQRQGVEMPLIEQAYKILFQGKDPRDVVKVLLERPRKGE